MENKTGGALALKNLLPTYFPATRKDNSGVWGKDLVFDKGEFVKIVAPSGSGKTSLIHFIYGLRKDYSGEIIFNGKNMKGLSREETAGTRKNELSVVFQDMRLFPEQTVRQNLEIKRQLNPFYEKGKLEEMCRRLGISEKMDVLCKTCSYGEQQRVSIIRAMLQPYTLLLLDEPFSHLDDNNAKKAMELMEEESRLRGATILFADLERVDFFKNTRLLYL
jgi:putative ABC transport system ATP-binding protein